MEAAALYAFAAAAAVRVLCLAHVTNAMGQAGDDFEKGEADGAPEALAILAAVITALAPLDAIRGPRPAPREKTSTVAISWLIFVIV